MMLFVALFSSNLTVHKVQNSNDQFYVTHTTQTTQSLESKKTEVIGTCVSSCSSESAKTIAQALLDARQTFTNSNCPINEGVTIGAFTVKAYQIYENNRTFLKLTYENKNYSAIVDGKWDSREDNTWSKILLNALNAYHFGKKEISHDNTTHSNLHPDKVKTKSSMDSRMDSRPIECARNRIKEIIQSNTCKILDTSTANKSRGTHGAAVVFIKDTSTGEFYVLDSADKGGERDKQKSSHHRSFVYGGEINKGENVYDGVKREFIEELAGVVSDFPQMTNFFETLDGKRTVKNLIAVAVFEKNDSDDIKQFIDALNEQTKQNFKHGNKGFSERYDYKAILLTDLTKYIFPNWRSSASWFVVRHPVLVALKKLGLNENYLLCFHNFVINLYEQDLVKYTDNKTRDLVIKKYKYKNRHIAPFEPPSCTQVITPQPVALTGVEKMVNTMKKDYQEKTYTYAQTTEMQKEYLSAVVFVQNRNNEIYALMSKEQSKKFSSFAYTPKEQKATADILNKYLQKAIPDPKLNFLEHAEFWQNHQSLIGAVILKKDDVFAFVKDLNTKTGTNSHQNFEAVRFDNLFEKANRKLWDMGASKYVIPKELIAALSNMGVLDQELLHLFHFQVKLFDNNCVNRHRQYKFGNVIVSPADF